MRSMNIMMVGVGGQGSLLASRVLGNVALACGFDVKVSEVHGMSQRGGSVVTYVKFSDKVYSPIIEKGEADMVIAFELLEGYRWVEYLKKGGTMIINTQKIEPMPVITGAMTYPDEIIAKLDTRIENLKAVDALALAIEAGNVKSVNVVLLGVLAKNTDISYDIWADAIKATVPAKFLDMNMKAFELGYKL